LKAYVELLIKTCHRRGAHAIGGMAAQIPIKNDLEANEAALASVRADKEREVLAGHDGTWVAHPGLVQVARAIFDKYLPEPNQIRRTRDGVRVTAKDLLQVPAGEITEEGLRHNIRVGVQYIESWLRGNGCVPLDNLMEDAATAEISRAQVWQWIRHGAKMKSGQSITSELVMEIIKDEFNKLRQRGKYDLASSLFLDLVTSKKFEEYLTLPAYKMLVAPEQGAI
jgi:malate synthase